MLLKEIYPLIKINEDISIVYENNHSVLGQKDIQSEEDIIPIEDFVVKEIIGSGQSDIVIVVEK